MKLMTTCIQTETVTVQRNGQTIGDLINAIIADSLEANDGGLPSRLVTHIELDISPEDLTALRLLKSPAFQNDETVDTSVASAAPYRSKLKPKWPSDRPVD